MILYGFSSKAAEMARKLNKVFECSLITNYDCDNYYEVFKQVLFLLLFKDMTVYIKHTGTRTLFF